MNDLPGLTAPPLLQTLELVADPIRFFDKYRQRYGDTFTARPLGLGSPRVVFLGDPRAIQMVFTAPPDCFELGKVTHVFRPLTGDKSLIMLDGEPHQRQRKLLMPPFHGDRLRFYGETISEIASGVVSQLPKTGSFAIRHAMSEITLRVILQVVFGLAPGDRYRRLKQLIAQLLEEITQPLYSSLFFFPPLQVDLGAWSPWGHFRRQQQEIDRLIYAEIKQRRQEDTTQRQDVLSLLLGARDEAGQSMSDRELRDQLITLLLLGHETTASSLAWAIHWIHTYPEIGERVQSEIAAATSPEGFAKASYLNAVCQETLRLYPIALISQPRILKVAMEMAGRTFEEGAILVPCIYLAHHRPETFPDSYRFQPERFLERKYSPYEFFPFGGGTRSCIGGAFSVYEMKLVLGTVLSRVRLRRVEVAPVRPVRRGITIVPSSGVKMAVQN